MRKITDSAIYNQIAKNAKVMSVLANQQIVRDKVGSNKLEEPLQIIKRKLRYPTINKSFSYLMNGRIVLINNPEYRLPKYMSTVGRMYQGKPVATVDISRFSKETSTGEYDIFPKTLFSLIQSGLILLDTMENWNRITTNINFLKSTTSAYVKLMLKVFDKQFAITINTIKADTVSFILAKFFLLNVCGKANSETVENVAHLTCFGGTALATIKIEESKLTEEDYKDVFTLFNALSNIRGIEKLNVRSFVENYVRMYGDASLLSIDYLPSFLNMCYSSIATANIFKDFIIENTAGKFCQESYTEFTRLTR